MGHDLFVLSHYQPRLPTTTSGCCWPFRFPAPPTTTMAKRDIAVEINDGHKLDRLAWASAARIEQILRNRWPQVADSRLFRPN